MRDTAVGQVLEYDKLPIGRVLELRQAHDLRLKLNRMRDGKRMTKHIHDKVSVTHLQSLKVVFRLVELLHQAPSFRSHRFDSSFHLTVLPYLPTNADHFRQTRRPTTHFVGCPSTLAVVEARHRLPRSRNHLRVN